MSALPPIADIAECEYEGPSGDRGSELARASLELLDDLFDVRTPAIQGFLTLS